MGREKGSMKTEAMVLSSMCDRNSYLSIPAMLDMFQDAAGSHVDSIGIGAFKLEEMGLFWVVSKLRLRIARRPRVHERIDSVTWIQPAERASCERDWSISQNGEQLAYVRSIWAALRRDSFKPARMADFYPEPDLITEAPDDIPFTRMNRDLQDAEPLGEYTVRSVDIDRGGHMNNVNYVRALLGCFSCDQLEEMNIRELDMQFLLQCYEGETMHFVKRLSQDGIMEVAALNEEGRVCFAAALK